MFVSKLIQITLKNIQMPVIDIAIVFALAVLLAVVFLVFG